MTNFRNPKRKSMFGWQYMTEPEVRTWHYVMDIHNPEHVWWSLVLKKDVEFRQVLLYDS